MSVRLRLRRGYVAAVIGTLGVALGVSGVVTAAADHALLRPLPLDEPSRVVLLMEAGQGASRRLASYPTFLDWQRADAAAFEGLGFARGWGTQLRTDEGPERLTAAFVSPGYLRVLGARPRLGRAFTPDEERTGGGDAAVISDALWRRAFGGDPRVVGRTVTFDDREVTIVGVLASGAGYPLWADLWRPIAAIADRDPALASRHHHSDSRVIARLRPGVRAADAARQLATVERRLATTFPEQGAEWTGAAATPLGDEVIGDAAPALRALAAAATLVLLVASLNVATLLLLRAMARERELAIRAALGAGRARLLRLVAAESATLGVAATGLGLALTAVGLRWLRAAAPDALPRAGELGLDGRATFVVIALGIVATLVASAAPLWRAVRGEPGGRASRAGIVEALRAGWQATTGGRGARRARGALVVAQLALAVALLTGAGLLLDSFRQLRAVDLGFDPSGVTVFWVTPPNGRYDDPAQAAALYERLVDAAAAVPGVESVALANHVPLSGGYIPTNVLVPGRQPSADGDDQALYKTVSTDYLRVMRTPLLRGRWFDASDMRGGAGVVINDAMARRFWPNADPVGKPVTIFRSSQARAGFGDAEPSLVIGVVAGERHLAVADEPVPEVYVPYTREVWPQISLAVRSRVPAARLEPALRRAVLGVEPSLPVRGTGLRAGFRPLGGFVDASLTDRRGAALLLGAFAAAALGLSALGLYGAIAFGVVSRTREFGVRLALGASPRDVRALVARDGARLAITGAVLGAGASYALARLVGALLYHTSPLSPGVLGGAVAVLAAVTVAASWVPARRASRTDAVTTLRNDA